MKTNNNTRLLCFVPYGNWLVHNQVDCIIGTALKIRGADVTLLTCDGLFQDDCYTLAHSKNQITDCANCFQTGQCFFGKFPLPLEQIRSYVDLKDLEEIERWLQPLDIPDLSQATYEGMPVGEWVRPSVRSFLVVNPRDLGNPEVQALFRKYILYTLIAYKAAQRFFDKFEPTHVMMFGGYGFLHAPIFHLAQSRGCRIITHERAQLPSRFMLASDDLVDSIEAFSDVVKAWHEVPLSEEEISEVRSTFFAWEKGENRIAGVFYSKASEETTVRYQLGIPAGRPILVVFTSAEHELFTEEQRRIVGRQLELINCLIDDFRNRSEYLVVRHHPNIGAGARSSLDLNYLMRAYEQLRDLPPNVRVVMPDEQLTSYALLWNASASIALMSTLAVESVAKGVPTVTLPISGYRYVATNLLEDFSQGYLSELVTKLFAYDDNTVDISQFRKAFAFMRAYQFKYSTKFESFGIKNSHEPEIRISQFEELAPGNDRTLDRICNFVSQGKSIYDLPQEEHLLRDCSVEHQLLRKELDSVRAKRSLIQEQSEGISNDRDMTLALVVSENSATGDLFSGSGLPRQRQALVEYRWIPKASDTLGRIAHSLLHSSAEYVLITNSKFTYDESFLNSNAAALRANAEKEGVFNAAWIVEDGKIIHPLFNTEQIEADFHELVGRKQGSLEIDDLLGFAIFRRSQLLHLFQEVRNDNEQSVREKLLNYIFGSLVLKQCSPCLRFEL